MKLWKCFTMAVVLVTWEASGVWAQQGQLPLVAPAPKSEKPAAAATKQRVSFVRDVAPILVRKCLACHGPKQPKSNYQVTTYELLLKEGDFGTEPIVPGKPEESMLYELLVDEDPDTWMPKDAERLPKEQIALIRRWIEQGARFDGPDPSAPLSRIIPRQYGSAPDAYPRPLPVTAVLLSHDGKQVITSGYNELLVWETATGKLLARWKQVPQRTYDLELSPDGKLLALAGGTPGVTGEVQLRDAASGKLLRVLTVCDDVVFAVAFSPDGKLLASAGADRTIRIFQIPEGKELHAMEDHADWVMDVAWSPDGRWLVSASRDKTAKVFDAQKAQAHTTYNGHGAVVYSAVFSADGKTVFSAAENRQIHQWNPQDGKKKAQITNIRGEIYRLTRAGEFLFAAASDRTVRQFRLANRSQVRSLDKHSDWVYAVSVHLPGQLLAAGTFDGKVFLWNLKDGKLIRSFYAAPGYSAQVAKK